MKDTEALQRSRNLIRQKWDPNFEWVVNDTIPWAPLDKPLAQAAIGLVTTCGAYCVDAGHPFDATNYYGDPSYREIPSQTPLDLLRFAHTHYDHVHVEGDASVGLPLDHFHQLEAEGVIGKFVDPTISFAGYLPQTRQLQLETAPAAANRLLAAGAEGALCQQSVGLIARAMEEVGIATVHVIMRREVAENVKPPRTIFVKFPFGAPLGPAGDKETQRLVIIDALTVLSTATYPGTIFDSDHIWRR